MTATHRPGDYLYHNQYRIEEILGIGGQGVVYRALHIGLNEPVAIKELFDASPETRAHFRWQAQMLRRLYHPALPRVMDFFESGQQTYLVMDYIAGEDLDRRVARGGAQPVTEVLAWSNTILDALHYLHSQQPPIIHRDLKPSNLKLTPDGKLYLVDFGLAKAGGMGSTTVTVAKGLTHGFAPLEQYGGRTGPRSDIYALGATLYYLLTAQAPLSANLRGSGDQMTPIQTLNPTIPPTIATWINQAIALRRDERWPTADAMRQAMPPPPAMTVPAPSFPTPHPATEPLPYQNTTSRPTQVPSRHSQSVPPYQTGPHSQRRTSQPRRKKRSNILPAALGVVALLLLVVITGGVWTLTNNNADDVAEPAAAEATSTAEEAESSVAADTPDDEGSADYGTSEEAGAEGEADNSAGSESVIAPTPTEEEAESSVAADIPDDGGNADDGTFEEAGAEGEADNSAGSESVIAPIPTEEPTHTVPPGAPTSTRRPTFTASPTQTPIPPSATPEAAQPTNTPAQAPPIQAPAPTPTETIARGQFSPFSTNTPVPQAPASYDSGPVALEPTAGASIKTETVIFKWGWNGPALAGGQQFLVRGFRDGEWLKLAQQTGTQSQVNMRSFGNFETDWEWYVVVIDSAGNEISPRSATLKFGISLGDGGGDDGGGDDGGGDDGGGDEGPAKP